MLHWQDHSHVPARFCRVKLRIVHVYYLTVIDAKEQDLQWPVPPYLGIAKHQD